VAFAAICVGIAGFNLLLAAGAPWGHLTQGGFDTGRLPPRKRGLAAGSAVLVALMALAILAQAGQGPGWPRWTGWAATFASALTLMANALTPSRAERRLWVPVAALALACALIVMID
jgi:hypothetical protein